MKKISVILPTYNEGANILEMISQIKKSLKNVEIIVSDDNSPDKTWKIVEDLKLKNVKFGWIVICQCPLK